MLEEIRKGLFSGFGAIFLTREKAEELTNKLVDEAKISKEEAKNLVDELFAKGTKQWSDIEASLSQTIHKGFESMDIASKKELHGLKSKVGKLEKRVEKLEQETSNEKEN